MSGFVIDTSAIVSVLLREPDADAFSIYLDRMALPMISAATVHEAYCVSVRDTFPQKARQIDEFLSLVEPEIVPFDVEQLTAAREAYIRYGRGSGNATVLNMGDCFSYALAKTRNLPLLFKGDDFIHTDIEPALKPA
ncbi:type II toxin-antitoxin system VapC family toxin [Mesorhizobium sp. KR9-304]|uniref:type II toxin-antitoxin system VapC family toxin n=1 Tax=Mesorhizobium sp. KR9-304 TaxID=3156614 RepID=UPI0032B33D2C